MKGCSSPHSTPATFLLDHHYRELGLDKGWDNERVNRLCRLLHVTPHELGKLCCVNFRAMNRYIGRNEFPPHVSLHFAIIEGWYLEAVRGLKQKPIVPIHLVL